MPPGLSVDGDHGTDKPKQVELNKYPGKMYKDAKKQSFSSSWYRNGDCLEYSVTKDAAFCYPCRNIKSLSSVVTFTVKGLARSFKGAFSP